VYDAQPNQPVPFRIDFSILIAVHTRLSLRGYPLFIEAHRTVLAPDGPRDARCHCIFFHGWNTSGGCLNGWKRTLGTMPGAEDWKFWRVDYPTHRWGFRKGAREVAEALRSTGENFENVILIGFSMGGVTARQMVADGFPCRALVSLCSPHEGITRWVPTHSPGTSSLHRRSGALRALNSDPIDIAARPRYHFFSITYEDRLGRHPHDGLIPVRSALGAHLGDVGTRRNIHLPHARIGMGAGPHLHALNPSEMPPAVETIARLMAESPCFGSQTPEPTET
jgi:pimeloyl-ACP methyl ester carboxylesterase